MQIAENHERYAEGVESCTGSVVEVDLRLARPGFDDVDERRHARVETNVHVRTMV